MPLMLHIVLVLINKKYIYTNVYISYHKNLP